MLLTFSPDASEPVIDLRLIQRMRDDPDETFRSVARQTRVGVQRDEELGRGTADREAKVVIADYAIANDVVALLEVGWSWEPACVHEVQDY